MSPWLEGLSETDLEWVEDRATFLHHGNGLPRAKAERRAVRELRARQRQKESPSGFPDHCPRGHEYEEKYQYPVPTPDGHIGFCFCGICRTKEMVKP